MNPDKPKGKEIIPPPINPDEDPGATKRPPPPPTPSERAREEERAQAVLQARLASEIERIGAQAEAVQAEQEVAAELGLAEEELRAARVEYAATMTGLDIKSEHAEAAGIEDIEAYRNWLRKKLSGKSTKPPEKM